jgi:hypothetical protein
MWTRGLNVGFPVLLLLCAATTAGAQQPAAARPAPPPAQAGTPNTPTYELSGGYQYLDVADQSFPFGLNVDGARHYGALGLVAEIGFAHDSEEAGAGLAEASATAWNLGVGGRWTGFNSGRVWPFAQVLIGAEVLNVGVEIAGIDESETETSFMFQPGVGVNFVVAEGIGIVGQIDYRRTFFDEPDDVDSSVNNQFRVFIGARMILD